VNATNYQLTIDTAKTPIQLAMLFERLVHNQSLETRKESTRKLLQEVLNTIRKTYGVAEEGPFSHFVDRLLEHRMNDIQLVAQKLESLPICNRTEQGIDEYVPLYFVLDHRAGEWIPCYRAEDNRGTSGWLIGEIRYDDGSSEAMPSHIGKWADCNEDGSPRMPFVEW